MHSILAQGGAEVPWAGPASALGTAGILVYLVFYFLTKYIPDLSKAHREERSELHADLMQIHTEHMEQLKEMSLVLQSIKENTRPLQKLIDKERERDDTK